MSRRACFPVVFRAAVLLLPLLIAGCGGGDGDTAAAGTPSAAAEVRTLALADGMDGSITTRGTTVRPQDDPLVRLGRDLFFSRALSVNYDVACASCHHPLLAGGDALSLPVGIAAVQPWRLGPGRRVDFAKDRDPLRDCDALASTCGPNVSRNSPTVFNSALYDRVVLWDGRVELVGENPDGSPQVRTPESSPLPHVGAGDTLLGVQAMLPVTSGVEMRAFAHAELAAPAALRSYLAQRFDGIEEVGADFVTTAEAQAWRVLFEAAFPSLGAAEPVTYAHVQQALSAYQSGQFFVETRWNRFLAGDATPTADELAGARLFLKPIAEGGLGCAQCHAGDHLTDQQFHITGFPQIGRGKRTDNREDRGRGDVTRADAELFAFRTPSLLNIALTAPYGHAGTFQDLPAVLRYHANPSVDRFVEAWGGLAQFAGRDLDAAYPQARSLTAAVLASPGFARDKLPMRDLEEAEVRALVAFLRMQTDRCASSPSCLAAWIPAAGDDPDGNMLVSGQPSPVDVELAAGIGGGGSGGGGTGGGGTGGGGTGGGTGGGGTGGGTGGTPASHALSFEAVSARANFPEQESCSPATATNTGQRLFVSRADELLLAAGVTTYPLPAGSRGPDFSHGYPASDWFISEPISPSYFLVAGGVSATYLDADCWPDLVFTGGTRSGVRFYRNDQGRRFNHQPGLLDGISGLGGYSTGVTYADLDGDYRREFLLGNLFAAATADHITHVDQDHTLILARRDDGSIYQAGSLPFLRNTYGISLGDVDADGDLDLYTAHWGVAQNSGGGVYWENRRNALVDAQAAVGLSQASGLSQQFNFNPSFADLDGDGWQDLVVASDFQTSQVLQNVDAGGVRKFERRDPDSLVITDQNGMGGVLADYDNDGDLDWFVTSIHAVSEDPPIGVGRTGNRLYQNTSTAGSVVFRDATDEAGVRDGAWGWGTCMEDFDNDGWLDIFMENGYGYIPPEYASWSSFAGYLVPWYATSFQEFLFASPRLFMSRGRNGNGVVTFAEAAASWGVGALSNGRGITCLDFDRDGDIDIVTLEHSGAPHFFVNQSGSGSGRHYLDVQVVGAAPNTDAVGARVTVRADSDASGAVGDGETQVRVVQANMTYNGRGLPNQHFGLGAAGVIAQLEVRWPADPVALVCTNVAAGRHVVIDQRTKTCP